MTILPDDSIPPWPRAVLRGVGQVFFQENAFSGACFVLGIALSSPRMALGLLVGSAIGCGIAVAMKFDRGETLAGLYGFNSALVGIATLFFFQTGVASVAMLIVGCAAAAPLTYLMRRFIPFPTYTSPFILITWVLFLLGTAASVARVAPGSPVEAGFVSSVLHGVGQVMFQANIWTGILFLVGIGLGDWQHAAWVLVGALLGALLGSYHATAVSRALDPERLVDRLLTENVALGLYGYNATLAAVALFLSRRSFLAPLLGILISVPITEYFPRLGLPALTAPFVLATWIVLGLGWLEVRLLARPSPSSSREPDQGS